MLKKTGFLKEEESIPVHMNMSYLENEETPLNILETLTDITSHYLFLNEAGLKKSVLKADSLSYIVSKF